MIQHVNEGNRFAFEPLLQSMHEDRKRIFIDRLRWGLPHDGRSERDQFDDEFAQYLVLCDRSDGEHIASMRLLRTDRPHLMSELFSDLCESGVPSSADVLEITRFCVAPRGRAMDRRLARNQLVRAMIEFALLTEVRAFTAVCEMGFLSEVLSAGWRCRPLGMPRVLDGKLAGALLIEIDPQTVRSLVGSWSCDPVELRLADNFISALAA